MSSAPKNRALLRGEVISRVHWGAADDEVLAYLAEQGVDADEAEDMLMEAHVARTRAVRGKAILLLVFAVAGILFSGVYFWIQGFVHFIAIGVGPFAMLLVGLCSWYVFFRSIFRLVTGRAPGSAQ